MLYGLIWWDRQVVSPLFLVVLVDKISTTIEYAGVEVASCGIFDVMKQRMYALN